MSRSIIYLGLDVHKDAITIAVLPADVPAPIQGGPSKAVMRYVAGGRNPCA